MESVEIYADSKIPDANCLESVPRKNTVATARHICLTILILLFYSSQGPEDSVIKYLETDHNLALLTYNRHLTLEMFEDKSEATVLCYHQTLNVYDHPYHA